MARKRKELTDILIEMGVLKSNDAQRAVDEATKKRRHVHEVLLDLKLASEEDITKALALQYDMEYIDLDKSMLAASNFDLIPADLIKRHQVLPMEKKDGRLRVVIGDPTDLDAIDALTFRLNTKLETCLGAKSKIKLHIEHMFAEENASIDDAIKRVSSMDRGQSIDLAKTGGQEADDAPIIKLVHAIISEAVKSRASDIHIEPMKDRVRVRYRIDGVCVERDNILKRMQGPVTARLKIMSGMDIAEKRLPQDGRIKMEIDTRPIDFRVSALPGYHGESIVLRILRPDNVKIGVQAMGFEEDDYVKFKRIISRPAGIFLVTGPTGSGKTTTLYSALNELNSPQWNIITVEDPVEFQIPGINQVPTKKDIGLTFANALRSILRQDPDIIMIGEIRDTETAEIAIEAALTGHQVLSTMHCNDAPGAIARLDDMGIAPFLISSSVILSCAQRLIRRICSHCKEPVTYPTKMFEDLGIDPTMFDGVQLFRGRGCDRCKMSGYAGRMAIIEAMSITDQIRKLIIARASTREMAKLAVNQGMKTLRMVALDRARDGVSTLEQVLVSTSQH